jgi:transcriptional regulator with XRE-family HTH domain
MTVTAAQVKAARELVKWSQSRLAAETGVSFASIVKFESGGKDAGIEIIEGESGVIL